MRNLLTFIPFAAATVQAHLIFNGSHYAEHNLATGIEQAREFGGEGVYWAIKSVHEAGSKGTNACVVSHTSYLAGNGNPHQNYVYTQKGDTFACPGTSSTQSFSVTVGWSVSGGISAPWISGGFSVSQSKTEGYSFNGACLGDHNGLHADQGCLQQAMAMTAYTVDEWVEYSGNCPGDRQNHRVGTAVIFSPNEDKGHQWFASANFGGFLGCSWNNDQLKYAAGPPGTSDWFNNQQPGIMGRDWQAAQEPAGYQIPNRVWAAAAFGLGV
jgi:hypothetical protein